MDSFVLGKIQVKFNGEFVYADLYSDGTVLLPDNSVRKLPPEQFAKAKSQIKDVAVRSQPQQQRQRGGGRRNKREEQGSNDVQGMKELGAFEAYDATTAERKMKRKKMMKVMIGIVCFLLIAAAVLIFIRANYPELIGMAPNSYRVAVANNYITSGSIFTDADVSYIELTRDEYTAQCVSNYMAEDGTMKTDVPLFFVNAQNEIVGHYAAQNIDAGTIIKESMVSNTNQVATVVVNGEEQTIEGTASEFYGETTVQIVAKVTNQNGEQQEVVLSTMRMQGRQLTDFLDSAGQSVLSGAFSNNGGTSSDNGGNQQGITTPDGYQEDSQTAVISPTPDYYSTDSGTVEPTPEPTQSVESTGTDGQPTEQPAESIPPDESTSQEEAVTDGSTDAGTATESTAPDGTAPDGIVPGDTTVTG